MTDDFRLLQFADNPVVWAILGLALFCYVLQFNLILCRIDEDWKIQVKTWLKVLPVLLSALPLLGLLGTIAGLLTTFRSMAISGSLDQQMLLGSGIADALITTQLGLITVIPGLLLQSLIHFRHQEKSI
ncbi:MAG: MotA/TolQ/ExbB proton channel family protein [Deltaproteobacteria bacterium]|nr:MotA/TolQ/ExbB proton channel family protein [Deltaproteobacteria bacterium]